MHRIAKDIQEAASRGHVTYSLRRWANEKLNPRVNWREALAKYIRQALSVTSGAVDYSYSRPSRRQTGNVIYPRLVAPSADIAIVIDTSGSMSDHMLSQALAETMAIIRAAGREATVFCVDAAVHTIKRVRNVGGISLIGGGGTDMMLGIEEALRMRPVPSVIVVITDGNTEWGNKPPVPVIVALIGNGRAPAWAEAVRVSV